MNLNEIKEALGKATPGPWEHRNLNVFVPDQDANMIAGVYFREDGENGELIANAPQWIASLIEHYEECRDDAVTLHKQVEEMQKTLEWYADDRNYKLGNQTILGERARQTLQSLKEDKP